MFRDILSSAIVIVFFCAELTFNDKYQDAGHWVPVGILLTTIGFSLMFLEKQLAKRRLSDEDSGFFYWPMMITGFLILFVHMKP